MANVIAVLDFGSQYTQLIARRVREAQVYCEMYPWNAPAEEVLAQSPCGFILSGGPASVCDPDAPVLPDYVIEQNVPILGICYGMQLLAQRLGGHVTAAANREFGPAEATLTGPDNRLFGSLGVNAPHLKVWMSHGDYVATPPPGFQVLAESANSPVAAMGDLQRQLYGLQFHPEVIHTPLGKEILYNFVVDVCGCTPDWTPTSFIEHSVIAIREQVGAGRVVCGLSGGVDSAVAATLVHRAIGDQLTCIFVNTGLLRQGEPEQVVQTFQEKQGMHLVAVDAIEDFLSDLAGVVDPEQKRVAIGARFIRVFEREARKLGDASFLAQGTLYPDVIESRGPERRTAARIKTHHNVGGLPPDMAFQLVEPLRYLFKDEVRAVGEALGLPDEIVWRQPFPGPGLAVRIWARSRGNGWRCCAAPTRSCSMRLSAAGLLPADIGQAFAVLLPVRSRWASWATTARTATRLRCAR